MLLMYLRMHVCTYMSVICICGQAQSFLFHSMHVCMHAVSVRMYVCSICM